MQLNLHMCRSLDTSLTPSVSSHVIIAAVETAAAPTSTLTPRPRQPAANGPGRHLKSTHEEGILGGRHGGSSRCRSRRRGRRRRRLRSRWFRFLDGSGVRLRRPVVLIAARSNGGRGGAATTGRAQGGIGCGRRRRAWAACIHLRAHGIAVGVCR